MASLGGDVATLRLPDCRTQESMPFCGPLRSVVNLSDVPIRIEGWYEQVNSWAPLVPHVPAASEYSPFVGALWLPKSVILRSVNVADGTPMSVFGAVGNGVTLVQQPSALVSPVSGRPGAGAAAPGA